MNNNLRFVYLIATFVLVPMVVRSEDPPVQKVTFDDHVKPIFREHCMSCHNAGDKNSGLAVDTYAAILEGGSSGKAVIEGNADGSRLYQLMAHKAQPKMPPERDRLPDPLLDTVRKWIEQGMPENSGSAIKKAAPTGSLAMAVVKGRPEGPPPMPEKVLQQPPVYTPKSAAISAIAASPWAPLVAVGGQEQVVLYHSETGKQLGILPFPEGEPQSIRFSRDGRLVLVGGGRHAQIGIAALYDLQTGERMAQVGDELDIVMEADISDDNRHIALGGPQKLVRIYDTFTGQKVFELKKHTDWIYAVSYSPDGVLLATADRSNGLVVWEAQTGRLYMDLVGHKSEIRSLAWRPDSSALISASLDGTVKIWNMEDGKELKSIAAHGGGVSSVAVCNNGSMVTTGKDGKVKFWDNGGNPKAEFAGLSESGLEVALTVDAKQVVAGDWLGNVFLWDVAQPANKKPLLANPPSLEMRIAHAKSSLEQSKSESMTARTAWESAQQKVDSVQKRLEQEDQALAQVTNALTAASQKGVQLRQESDQKAKAIAELEAALAKLRKEHEETIASIAQHDAMTKDMVTRKGAIEKQKSELSLAIQPMIDVAAKAKAAHEALHAKVQQAETQLDENEKELKKFVEYRAQVASRTDALNQQMELLSKEVAAMEAAAASEKQTIENTKKNLSDLIAKLTELQQKVQQEEKLQRELESSIGSREKASEELKKKLEAVQAEAANALEQKKVLDKAYNR